MEAMKREYSAQLAELDRLYNEVDKLYYSFARTGGLSSCAYWMLYGLVEKGSPQALVELSDGWSYSKQTINSALKSLEAKGLIELAFAEGSRKNKQARLTQEGEVFAGRFIVPAMQAEERAFASLRSDERCQLLAFMRKYANAIDLELQKFKEKEGVSEA